ncbi:hypothetical protein AAE478_006763 [Parahypoxylon ruwenzoriense]
MCNTMTTVLLRPSRVSTLLACICVLTCDDVYVESSVDWSGLPQHHLVSNSELASLPEGRPRDLPKVQFTFKPDRSSKGQAREKTLANQREEVKDAFLKSWTSYKEYAWMYDELDPIMELKTEFYDAVAAVATVDWAKTDATSCNIFEIIIRYLGGLLSAYDLSGEPVFL